MWMILYDDNVPVLCEQTNLGYWPLQPFLMTSLWGTCTFVGEEKVDGKLAYHFSFDKSFETNDTIEYWIEEDSLLPVRLVVSGIQTNVWNIAFASYAYPEKHLQFSSPTQPPGITQQIDYLNWENSSPPNGTFVLPDGTPKCQQIMNQKH